MTCSPSISRWVRLPLALAGQSAGLMGGSFNPPHAGHALVARTAMKRLALDRLWWIVTPGNPLKSRETLPPLAERVSLARKFARGPRDEVTAFESELGMAFTVDTLGALRARYRGVRFVWIMGADGLAGFHHWRHWRRIAALVPIAVIDRPGWRYRALSSPAAHALGRDRMPERCASNLASRRPPAWVYLTSPTSALSSTGIRAGKS